MFSSLDGLTERVAGSRLGRGIFIAFLTLIGLATLSVLAPLFLMLRFSIPASSMNPALQIGDLLLASHIAYDSTIDRGDVVLFWVRKDEQRYVYVKRVIGLPGDRVRLLNGVVFVNGAPLKRHKVADQPSSMGGDWAKLPAFEESLPGGRKITVIDAGASLYDDFAEVTVPADHYFMLGDNRDNSADSRIPGGIGFISRQDLIGKAKWIYFSAGPDGVRFGRIGQRIH